MTTIRGWGCWPGFLGEAILVVDSPSGAFGTRVGASCSAAGAVVATVAGMP